LKPPPGSLSVDLSIVSESDLVASERLIAIEAPISIEFNGLAYAVMMATPADLEDFAYGFSIAEGVVTRAEEVLDVDIYESELGWIVRIEVAADRIEPIRQRVRRRVSDGGCGLCGVENLENAMRPPPRARSPSNLRRQAIFTAIDGLRENQTLNAATGAVHAAALCDDDGAIREVREDVGRHNAFDKLVGALARRGVDPGRGFALLSSRCSYELVDKALMAGFSALVTISAPTSLAVSRARSQGLTLVALARADAALVMNDPLEQLR